MKIIIEGTYRRRLRVNLLLFKMVGKWEETPFRYEQDLPDKNRFTATLATEPVPISLTAMRNHHGEWWINLGIAGAGISLGHINPRYSTLPTIPIAVRPAKGVELTGTVHAVL